MTSEHSISANDFKTFAENELKSHNLNKAQVEDDRQQTPEKKLEDKRIEQGIPQKESNIAQNAVKREWVILIGDVTGRFQLIPCSVGFPPTSAKMQNGELDNILPVPKNQIVYYEVFRSEKDAIEKYALLEERKLEKKEREYDLLATLIAKKLNLYVMGNLKAVLNEGMRNISESILGKTMETKSKK